MGKLEGRTAIVTGGARGIGAHYSRARAAGGARVMVCAKAGGRARAPAGATAGGSG